MARSAKARKSATTYRTGRAANALGNNAAADHREYHSDLAEESAYASEVLLRRAFSTGQVPVDHGTGFFLVPAIELVQHRAERLQTRLQFSRKLEATFAFAVTGYRLAQNVHGALVNLTL